MNILIAGASGFIGSEIIKALKSDHSITVLGRDIKSLQRQFPKPIESFEWRELSSQNASHFDAVINLCGYNIAQSRWSPSVKQQLIDSRVTTNQRLIDWLIPQNAKPHYICANAVGIYGLQTNGDISALDESSVIDFDHPKDFLSEIGVLWEQSLAPAIEFGMPVTTTRFGVVVKKGQGLLKKLTPSFWMGLGSIIGDGEQIISWVHIDDVVASMLFLLMHPELTGAFNITSPNPVSQREFATELAHVLQRPLLLKTPAFIIKTLFSEMGECLLLKGQRVIPKRLQESGYMFLYPNVTDALRHEYKE